MQFNVTNSINKDSIKYIDSWIKALKDNKNSIDAVSAAVILESFLLQNEGNKN